MAHLTETAFDAVAGISGALKGFFTDYVGGNSDVVAGCIAASSLLLLAACYYHLTDAGWWRRMGWKWAAGLIFLAIFLAASEHIGSRMLRIEANRIKPGHELASKVRLDATEMKAVSTHSWKLFSTRNGFETKKIYLIDPELIPSPSVFRVAREGRGHYTLKGQWLWFAAPDGSDPVTNDRNYFLLIESAWLPYVRKLATGGFILAGFAVGIWALIPTLIPGFVRLCRMRSFQIVGACFILIYGWHQSRFLNQTPGMQMVTSRDDDGYMMKRLQEANKLVTLDPYRVNNNAYAAIAYYVFAALPATAGSVGLELPLPLLNGYVRGLKMLMSLGLLAAVIVLAARHFPQYGQKTGAAAAVLVATNFGFLAYSSYPFYPDVLMAFFTVVAVTFTLDLLQGWSDRSFYFAVLFASISVSIKYYTVLVLPFLIIVGGISAWRHHGGRLVPCFKFCLHRIFIAGIVALAAFFICNPYPEYTMTWLAPNGKMASTVTSVDTPNLVSSGRATALTWLNACYRFDSDRTDLIAALLAFIGVPLLSALSIMRRKSAAAFPAANAVALLIFVVAFQLFIFKSCSLSEAIDPRFLLPIFPLIDVLAAWIVLHLLHLLAPSGTPFLPRVSNS